MQRKLVAINLSALVCVTSLTGCASNKSLTIVRPPVERLTCQAEPSVPDEATDATVAQFIVDLRGAGQDCRSNLQWVNEFFAKQ